MRPWACVVAFALLAAAACDGDAEMVAFEVCTRNDSWTRPTQQEMQSVWANPRYAGLDDAHKQDGFDTRFSRYFGSTSISQDILALSGLRDFWESSTGECGAEEARHFASANEKIEIWTLLYDVDRVEKLNDGYRVVVMAVDRGFRSIQFGARETYEWNVHIVTTGKDELGCIGPPSRGGRC